MVKNVPLVAAAAFAVLSVCAVVVVPLGPGVERPGSDVVDHIAAHSGMIRLQVLLTALALLALAVVLGYARDRLDGPAGQVFIAGSAVFIAQTGVRAWLDAGLALHPSALDPAVARAVAGTTDFTRDFQELITAYAWGEIWTRPGLDRRSRSMITITALIARGHLEELELHMRAARTNGLTDEEIKEVLLQTAIYCGVPDANAAFRVAERTLGRTTGRDET